jgi:hypothetical protein
MRDDNGTRPDDPRGATGPMADGLTSVAAALDSAGDAVALALVRIESLGAEDVARAFVAPAGGASTVETIDAVAALARRFALMMDVLRSRLQRRLPGPTTGPMN